MSRYLPCFLFSILFLPVFAFQTDLPDSLFARAQGLYKGKDYAAARQVFGDARQAFEAADNFEMALEAVYKMAYCDFYTRDFLSGVGLIDSALPLFREKLSDTSFLVAKLLILKGVSCRRLEDYGNALAAYEGAINIYEALDTVHTNVVYAYRNAAQIYSRRLDYRRAIIYLEKALEKDVNGDSGALLHSLLADNYAFLGDY
ncbi:MAG: tetratricopeptide repeat protein, partial [Bacteroidetes bacterium]